jgi:2-methylisoborneol synthase
VPTGEHANHQRTTMVPPRPTGLGTSAAALAENSRPARVVTGLYCPSAVRDDPALATTVQQRLDTWADGVGAPPAAVTGLGRLAMLTHPDTADPARLAVAGQLLALGAMVHGQTLPNRAATMPVSDVPVVPVVGPDSVAALDAAVEDVFHGCDIPDHPHHPSRPAVPGMLTDHPVAVSALAGLSALPASPYQVDRVRREYETLAAGAPTRSGPHPPWEHLALGHVNAYSPILAAIDAIDGYELPPSAAVHPELRRIRQLAALAAALLHDVAAPSPTGLSAAIARADGLGTAAATRRAAAVHDDAMRAFHQHATQLAGSTAEPAIRRYLAGLWTWLGGHRTWHTDQP